MQRKKGSMLLRGAMTVMLLAALPLAAQEKPATGPGGVKYPLEVAFTYNAARGQTIGNTSFWMQGAGMQIEGRVTPHFGVVADVTGTQAGKIGSTGVGLDLVTATFGPRMTWTPAHRRYAVRRGNRVQQRVSRAERGDKLKLQPGAEDGRWREPGAETPRSDAAV